MASLIAFNGQALPAPSRPSSTDVTRFPLQFLCRPVCQFWQSCRKCFAADLQQNFWRWFGTSKVVDELGPLRVFHSTTRDFSEFDVAHLGDNTNHSTAYLGFYFSVDAAVADMFTEAWDMTRWPHRIQSAPGARTMPVFLSIKKPKVLTVAQFRDMVIVGGHAAKGQVAKDLNALRAPGVLQRIFGENYDGVLVKGDPSLADTLGGAEWRADTWVAFRPNQIKSALACGRFDPSSDDITA